jgi:hypothetical protein
MMMKGDVLSEFETESLYNTITKGEKHRTENKT